MDPGSRSLCDTNQKLTYKVPSSRLCPHEHASDLCFAGGEAQQQTVGKYLTTSPNPTQHDGTQGSSTTVHLPYLIHGALGRKLIDSFPVSRRYASQSDVVYEQRPSREVDRPCSVPRLTYFFRHAVIRQAGGLLVGLDGALDVFGNPGDDSWLPQRCT